MTSKDALQHIINLVCDDTYYRDRLEEEFEVIKKDLEATEILKKHLKTTFTAWAEIITCDIDSLRDEDYEIIEEWLHNDK